MRIIRCETGFADAPAMFINIQRAYSQGDRSLGDSFLSIWIPGDQITESIRDRISLGEYMISGNSVTFELKKEIITDPRYWDCECENYYIHAKADRLTCPECAACESDSPDARLDEVQNKETRYA